MATIIALTVVSIVMAGCLGIVLLGTLLPKRWNLTCEKRPRWLNHDGTHIDDVGIRQGTRLQRFQEWLARYF